MSDFSIETLNNGEILVGNCSIRPPWWADRRMIETAIQLGLLAKSPLYDGPIPWEDAYELLSFAVVAFCVYGEVVQEDGTISYVEFEGKRMIGKADGSAMFGVFSDTYNVTDHQYDAIVLDVARALVDGDDTNLLSLLSVGLLNNGAKAFSTIAVPEWVDTAGGPVMPYISSSTGFDGMLSSGWYMGGILQVCDNTARAARAQGEKSGRIYKVKHTKNSGLSISSAREALGLLDEYASELTADIQARVEYPVSDQEWSTMLDVMVPVPEVAPGGSTRGETMANNKRDVLWDLWRTDDRVSPWRNTAQGVVQAFSTYAQHDAIVRGTNRVARNIENDLNGKFADIDETVMATLTEVCARDLVFA